MFTGIIEALGRIRALEPAGGGSGVKEEGSRIGAGQAARIEIAVEAPGFTRLPAQGASIAVNGCCLTVTEAGENWFRADLSPETTRRTTFADLTAGTLVSLERPLSAGAELGGHFVLGHVDGVGRIERIERDARNGWLRVAVPPELVRYVAQKGSMAIDGISLTVAACSAGLAEFALIPYTLAHTHLRERTAGDRVNLECDVLARYLERLLAARESPTAERLSLERLIEEGF